METTTTQLKGTGQYKNIKFTPKSAYEARLFKKTFQFEK